MIGLLSRRAGWSLLVLCAVATTTFIGTLKVGDPVRTLAGPHASARDRAHVRQFYGLDRPVYVQYGRYMSHLVRGDLGRSYRYREPVALLIGQRLPRTAMLALMAILIEVTLGVTFGTIAAARKGSSIDTLVMSNSFLLMSLPTFVSGQLILMVFAYYTGWFPIGGYGVGFWDHLYHAILPATTLALLSAAFYARMTRNEMIEILQADYIRTARAKGARGAAVVLRHGLRNALLPIVTSLGSSFGALFSGAIVTEAIFAWPGMGRLVFESITGWDVPVIVGCALVGSFGILLGNFLSDMTYALLDPRIRRE